MTPTHAQPAVPATRQRRALFEQEVLVHLDAMYGVAVRMTRDPASAEDLVQDTVLKAIGAWDQYQTGTNLKAWLLRILTNTFINRFHRAGLERDVLEGPDADPLSVRWIGASTMRAMRDPEREALAPLVEAEVQHALESLPEAFRMVVVLSDIEGLSYKEIADAVGCPIGTVMSRLHRGRSVLQQLLRSHAEALGLVPEQSEEEASRNREASARASRAAVGHEGETRSLTEFRSRRRGGN